MQPLEIWPTFGLAIRTPRLELRAVTPELVFPLIELADGGVHDPELMPFLIPWTDQPAPQRQRDSARHYWNMFATLQPESWKLSFAVFDDGELVGIQDAMTEHFPRLRTFLTGSWLGRAHHGRGIGKEMRAAILHLLFEGLGAQRATTEAFVDNHPSLGVTRSLGYEENGTRLMLRRGEPALEQCFLLTRERWLERRRDDIELVGVTDECLAFLGLAPDVTVPPPS